MKTSAECWECFAHSFSRIVKNSVPDAKRRKKIISALAGITGRYFDREAPCDIGTRLNLYIQRYAKDPLRREKDQSTASALKILKEIDRPDISLEFALKASLLGNIMDFVVKDWDHRDHDLKKLLSMPIRLDHSRQLEREIRKASNVLFLTDNAGEAVLDYFLLKYMKIKGKTVILSPKSGPIQNDATLEDIKNTPVMDVIDRITPTACAVGLNLKASSPAFRAAFRKADLVIMKGMGYYENAFNVAANSFFLLKAKCRPVAESLGVRPGDNAVVGRKFFKSRQFRRPELKSS